MTRFLTVDVVQAEGTHRRLVNVDMIEDIAPADRNGQAKCVIYLASLRTLQVTQTFTWFEQALESRRAK